MSQELKQAALDLINAAEAACKHFGYARLGGVSLEDSNVRVLLHNRAAGLRAALARTQQPEQGPSGRDVLMQVFALCEATEGITLYVGGSGPGHEGFVRGRKFEAKGIRNAIGNWYQDSKRHDATSQQPEQVVPEDVRSLAAHQPEERGEK